MWILGALKIKQSPLLLSKTPISPKSNSSLSWLGVPLPSSSPACLSFTPFAYTMAVLAHWGVTLQGSSDTIILRHQTSRAVCNGHAVCRAVCGNRAELLGILEMVLGELLRSTQILWELCRILKPLGNSEEHSSPPRNCAQRSGICGNRVWCSGTWGSVHSSQIFGELFRLLRNFGKLSKVFEYLENYKECSSVCRSCAQQSGIWETVWSSKTFLENDRGSSWSSGNGEHLSCIWGTVQSPQVFGELGSALHYFVGAPCLCWADVSLLGLRVWAWDRRSSRWGVLVTIHIAGMWQPM